ncbi:hypothetical protein LXL04_018032 [Taraxacum kok-saghyz]
MRMRGVRPHPQGVFATTWFGKEEEEEAVDIGESDFQEEEERSSADLGSVEFRTIGVAEYHRAISTPAVAAPSSSQLRRDNLPPFLLPVSLQTRGFEIWYTLSGSRTRLPSREKSPKSAPARSHMKSRSFENSYIPENPRTPKPLTFSKIRLRGAKITQI